MRRREIAVDLTSLLDVILIILFMFVVNTSSTVANSLNEESQATPTPMPTLSADATIDDVNEQITIAKSELEALLQQQKDVQSQSEEIKNQVISDSIWLNTCLKINVSIELDDEKANRIVKIQQRDEEVDEYSYSTSRNYKEIIDDLKTVLKNNYLDVENVEQVVLFVYTFDFENGEIENHMIVEQTLEKLQKEYDNIYITKHDVSKSESTVVEEDKTVDDTEGNTSSDNTETTEESTDTETTTDTSNDNSNELDGLEGTQE